jgi:hypothetical protein
MEGEYSYVHPQVLSAGTMLKKLNDPEPLVHPKALNADCSRSRGSIQTGRNYNLHLRSVL